MLCLYRFGQHQAKEFNHVKPSMWNRDSKDDTNMFKVTVE